jgi:hypothetical protein
MKLLTTTIAITALVIAFQMPSSAQSIASTGRKCSIENSVYEAIDNPDFELIFSPRLPGKAMDAVVTLKHSKRGKIQTFRMVTSNGYGSSFLINPQREGTSLNIVVFDRNLKKDNIFRNKVAPEYVFVSGLGSEDYYSNNSRNREFLLGEQMWKFDRCSL